MWYPLNPDELRKLLDNFLESKEKKKINGIIAPHAGYEFSGKIAGKAFSLINGQKIKKAIVIGPSHYSFLKGVVTTNKKEIETPIGKMKIFNLDFPCENISQEHSIDNQYPFLARVEFKEIMPLMIGQITNKEAEKIAKKISHEKAIFIFSTDLSHFFPYEKAVEKDKKTIKIIESLNIEKFSDIDACGQYPLLILMHLCRILKTKPKLIEYKNSGDVTGDKSSVVGYGSFWF